MPRISVVLPTYNRAAMVQHAIQSVCNQTFQDWELIVINDGSHDTTGEVLKGFSKKDPRIKAHFQKNRGITASRSRGTALASGEYLAFLDDDDVFTADKLEKQAAFLDQHPEIDLVYSQVETSGQHCPLPKIWPPEPATDFHDLIKGNTIQPNAVLMRRKMIEKVGNFRTDLKTCDDFDMWLRVAYHGKIAFLPGVVGSYHWHASNVSRNSRERSKNNLKIFLSLLKGDIASSDKAKIREFAGFKNYIQASDALEQKRYDAARYHFGCAILIDPAVGVSVPWNPKANKFYRFLRPYIGYAFSFLKGLK